MAKEMDGRTSRCFVTGICSCTITENDKDFNSIDGYSDCFIYCYFVANCKCKLDTRTVEI